MACTRDRIIDLSNYLSKKGIHVNLKKNKAQGKKGFFKTNGDLYRIDIAKDSDELSVLSTLIHESTHFVHYNYDKKLKSLSFIFDDYDGDYIEDLSSLTVDSIPKSSVEPLFTQKEQLEKETNSRFKYLKSTYPNIRKNEPLKELEKNITKSDIKYLLKYDKVKIFKGLGFKLYSIENIEKDFPNLDNDIVEYVKFKSSQRHLRKINSKIQRLNRYYNQPSELLARSFEYYLLKPDKMKAKTFKLYNYYNYIIENNKIPMLTDIKKIF